jgi:hypothetical protein
MNIYLKCKNNKYAANVFINCKVFFGTNFKRRKQTRHHFELDNKRIVTNNFSQHQNQ